MSIITTENIYQEVMSHSEFYSLMYPNFVKFYSVEEQIVPIKTSSVKWNPTKTLFYYIWGCLDCNIYDANNYGRTWTFTKEELLQYWKGIETV